MSNYPPFAFSYNTKVAAGLVPGVISISQSGTAPAGMQTTATDVWGRADATPTQQIWLAPTTARIHAIVSGSASDDGSPAGVGARTVRVWGLTSWTADEVFEDIVLNGVGAVNTVNSYVMINRMQVLTSGATSINVGTITATAATDGTITCLILAGDGVSQQAIYGLPSTKTVVVNQIIADMASAGAQDRVSMNLMINYAPSDQITIFTKAYPFQLKNSGQTGGVDFNSAPIKIRGPALLKLQGVASAADLNCTASLEMYLYNNNIVK